MDCDDRRRLMGGGRKGDVDSRLALQWIRNAIRAAEEVGTGTPHWSALLLWYVLLYDILSDMHERLRGFTVPLFEGAATPYRDLFARATEQVEVLQRVFTRDELLYIQYRRDEACHSKIDSYDYRLRDGKVKKNKETLLGILDLSEIDASITRLLRSVNLDEVELARSMAARSLSALVDVHRACLPLFG